MEKPDPAISTSCFCNKSADFCGEDGGLAMYCQTCDGDSHLCSDLHLHYAYFSQENLPKVVGGINPHRVNKEQNLQTLPLEPYIKLVNNSRSISKVTRSLAKYNFIMDTLEAMPIKPNTTTMEVRAY